SKRWVHEQYDTMVQTNTVIGPGGEAGVMRIKGTGSDGHERGLAMALDGNGRWCYLDPRLGAMHAVAECARKVAMTGATPVAATNCLNFGNPEKPEIMAQLSAAISGIAEACTLLHTPITGGNVSLYNETRGVGIYPTPVLGIVGILDDVTKAVPADFQRDGDAILLLWPVPRAERPDPAREVPAHPEPTDANSGTVPGVMGDEPVVVSEEAPITAELAPAANAVFGSSEYAKAVLGSLWGAPPPLDLAAEADLHALLGVLADRQLVHSARDISDGGIAVALAQSAFPNGIGAAVEQEQSLMVHPLFGLFAEPASTVFVTADPNQTGAIEELADEYGYSSARIGTTGGDRLTISVYGNTFISASVDELRRPWAQALKSVLHQEVTA
ncbi:MAG: AIR synthase related protein, partial [Terracidiphilus sp.]